MNKAASGTGWFLSSIKDRMKELQEDTERLERAIERLHYECDRNMYSELDTQDLDEIVKVYRNRIEVFKDSINLMKED